MPYLPCNDQQLTKKNKSGWQKSIQLTLAYFQKMICFVWAAIPTLNQKKGVEAVRLENAAPTSLVVFALSGMDLLAQSLKNT